MKNVLKLFGIFALVAIIGFSFAALSLTGCSDITTTDNGIKTPNTGDGTTTDNETKTPNTDDGSKPSDNKLLESIDITTPPNKTIYNIGDKELITTGMIVTATYSDGSTEAVTGYTIVSGFDTTTKGVKEITVKYKDKTATFSINVIDPNISTVATPTASPSGGQVANGTKVTLVSATEGAEIWYTTDETLPAKNGAGSVKYTTPFSITPPVTIKATAFKDGMNNSGMLVAEYTATPITTAEIDITLPTKGGIPVTAISGEEEHFTAGTVTWSPNDNPFKPVTEYTATVTLTAKDGYTFTSSTTAKISGQTAAVSNNTGKTITLSYKFTATNAKSVSNVVISTPPANLTYTHGDTLDLSDMEVTLTYDDNTTEDVTGANFINKGITANPSNGDKLVRSIHNGNPITITYGSFTRRTSNLTVNAKNASALSIDAIAAQTYTGSEIKPVITVKDGAETLTLTTDYTVSYSNNTNAGTNTAAVTITGTGDYTGNKTANFTINKANPTVTTWPTAASITYGSALSVSALSGGDTHGAFAWTSPATIPQNVGNHTYSVTFTPTDTANYNTATNTVSITVTPANLSGTITISPNSGIILGTQLTATYSGSETVSYQWKNGATNVGTNSNNFKPTAGGSYTVTVSATNYNSKTSDHVTVNAWTAVSNSPFNTGDILAAIAYGNGKFVAGGGLGFGKMAYSTDGETWTAVANSPFSSDAIAYGNGKFVAGSGSKMAYSTDGETWTAVANSTFGTYEIGAIAYGNGKFVAGGGGYSGNSRIAYSTDGETWTAVNRQFDTQGIYAIAYGNGTFVAGGYNGQKLVYSTDGETWQTANRSNGMGGSIRAIAYGNGKFVVGGGYGEMAYSTDGETWTAIPSGTGAGTSTFGTSAIRAIAYGNGKFVAAGADGKMAYLSVE
jgi:hypothetical protein